MGSRVGHRAIPFALSLLLAPACAEDLPPQMGVGSESDTSDSDSDSSSESDTRDESSESETGETEAGECADELGEALINCVYDYGELIDLCYIDEDQHCNVDAPELLALLETLELAVLETCDEGELFGLSREALAGRLRNACSSHADSLAWRTYGGPQGAVWEGAGSESGDCLINSAQTSRDGMELYYRLALQCWEDGCTAEEFEEQRAFLIEDQAAAVCDQLPDLVALPPEVYAERSVEQADCLLASVVPEPGPGLRCGPGHAQFEAARGEWTQIVVEDERWNALCGDGSPYAFWVQLAPEGQPLDRVFIGLQGGGVCLFEEDCTARFEQNPGLFSAMDDMPLGSGIGSDDPAENPFAEWTRVYLPYCNQDVFAGGGVTESLGALELPRHGGLNLRAAVRMVRDVLWSELDVAGDPGFRPDEIVALFGGWSAGAYGTLYNYHWLLDDLQWPRTIAFPDAGLALDNGTPFGVGGLGLLKLPQWGTQPNLPPYCFAGDCAIGPVLYEAISPRLLQVPEQQMLILTNPKDNIQQGDAFFMDEAEWINTMRQSFCDTRELPGINYYWTSVADESLHVVTIRPELWAGEVDGEVMRDWFVRAVEDPDSVEHRVEEGQFVDLIPGVEPFPCPLG